MKLVPDFFVFDFVISGAFVVDFGFAEVLFCFGFSLGLLLWSNSLSSASRMPGGGVVNDLNYEVSVCMVGELELTVNINLSLSLPLVLPEESSESSIPDSSSSESTSSLLTGSLRGMWRREASVVDHGSSIWLCAVRCANSPKISKSHDFEISIYSYMTVIIFAIHCNV